MLADDIVFQGDGNPKVVATSTVADLKNGRYYSVAEPQYINPVPVKGLSDRIIGYANLRIANNRYLVADLYFNYETEERLLMDNGEHLWTELVAPRVQFSHDGWSWLKGVSITDFPIDALRITQADSGLFPMIRLQDR